MDIEIFVHGVPNGQSFWGKEEDRNYFGNFYGQSNSDVVKYLIQTRSSNGKAYCYYNYLVYQNVIGSDGREGSYFGLSIRFDAYCKDFIGIYKILDVVFTAHVQNKILKAQNGKYKYVVADFGSASELMGNIKDAIWKLLQSMLTNESVCSLGGFVIGGGNLPTSNIYEISANVVETTLKQYGKIALSPYYPTGREKSIAQQCDSKLQSVKQQYEDRYRVAINAQEQTNRSLQNSLASAQRECAKLQETVAGKDTIIVQKESDITNLKYQIKQIGQTKKTIENLNLIKAPITELANVFGGQGGQGGEDKSFSVKRVIPIVNFLVNLAILLFVLILVALLMFKLPTKGESSDKPLRDSISVLLDENETLKKQLYPIGKDGTPTEEIFNTFSSAKSVRIDVQGYNERNKHLEKGVKYSVKVLHSQNPEEGNWEISGGEIIGGHEGKSIEFIPKDDNEVTIKYSNSNGETESRRLKVKKIADQ